MVRVLSESLRQMPRDQTLLMLPQGEMINYLVRLPSPVATMYFFGPETSGGREEKIVNALQRRPPDWIVIISLDLSEHDVQHYGEKPGSGQLIIHWVTENYELAAAMGGDPLGCRQPGGVILKRKVESNKSNRSATQILPVFLEAQMRVAYDLCQQGDFAGAVACYRLALQSYPDTPALLNNLARLLLGF